MFADIFRGKRIFRKSQHTVRERYAFNFKSAELSRQQFSVICLAEIYREVLRADFLIFDKNVGLFNLKVDFERFSFRFDFAVYLIKIFSNYLNTFAAFASIRISFQDKLVFAFHSRFALFAHFPMFIGIVTGIFAKRVRLIFNNVRRVVFANAVVRAVAVVGINIIVIFCRNVFFDFVFANRTFFMFFTFFRASFRLVGHPFAERMICNVNFFIVFCANLPMLTCIRLPFSACNVFMRTLTLIATVAQITSNGKRVCNCND